MREVWAPRRIVHHKEHLTPENINTPEIALGENNLELLCRDCHALAHASDLPTDRGLMFDEEGNLVERELCHKHKNERRRPAQIADAGSTPLRHPHASRVIHKRRGKCGQKSEAAEMKRDPRRSSGLEALPPTSTPRG